MRSLLKISAFLSIIVLQSCGVNRVYTTGSYGAVKTYTEKSKYKDATETNTYITGSLSSGSHPQEARDFEDKKYLTNLKIHRSTSGKFYNVYYGMGFSFGAYHFEEPYPDLIGQGEKKAFYNLNLKAGLNYAYTRPKVDWRFIGFELKYLNEFGPYQDKLDEISQFPDESVVVVNRNSMLTFNLYSEYAFKLKENSCLTVGVYFGDLFESIEIEDNKVESHFSGFTLGLTLNKVTLHAVIENSRSEIKSTTFGITYKL